MLRRLRSIIAWNERYRAPGPESGNYHGSLAPRNYGDDGSRRDIDPATHQINVRL